MSPKTTEQRIVVLKSDRLYGDLICREVKALWRDATVRSFQRGLDALDSIQAAMPDLFITGVKIEDMDGLEHLEPFVERDLPILIVTSRKDVRTIHMLRSLRYNGIYDGLLEGLENLPSALERVMNNQPYVSASYVQLLKKPRNVTLDALTSREHLVLSVIGDGSDDQEAAERLSLSHYTVNTHRKSIMAKLKLHHKGQLMLYAIQQGYVRLTPTSIHHPGFQRRLQAFVEGKPSSGKGRPEEKAQIA